MSNLLFCLMGPTAVGKTDVACELVQHFPFEIISVDSAMIYRDMNIGTAKPAKDILKDAPHYLIDILDPVDSYSAALFCEDVTRLSQTIREKGKIPLLVGGTMMYFKALQQGLSLLPEADESVRATLSQKALQHGWLFMHEELARVDPITAARIHPNDTQRIQRALEVYELTQRPLSDFFVSPKIGISHQFVNLILMPESRAWLHERIAKRFEAMLAEGLIDEVENLIIKWGVNKTHPSTRSVGYRQVLDYLEGHFPLHELSLKGIAATRQLAKRQLTWLRHWPEGYILAAENQLKLTEIMAITEQILDNFKQ